MATDIAGCSIEVKHDNPEMDVTLTPRNGEEPGIEYLDVKITANEPTRPSPIKLQWVTKSIDMQLRTGTQWRYALCGMGSGKLRASAAQQAPVYCTFNYSGDHRLTFAVADAINTCELSAMHAEETACITFGIELFVDPVPPLTEYKTTIRFDKRKDQKYWDALAGVSDWWASMPEYKPAPVPEAARVPFYSTWYSYHLGITPEAIEKECKLARELGMEAVIVDDGWQTDVVERGYAWCGDWEAAKSKFPDMRAHVDRVHKIGMKYLLWFSVPFMGVNAKNYERFKDKFLTKPEKHPEKKWFTLDPRFPEVREYLIGVYERCIKEFDLDGFKLDFIDCFGTSEETKDEFEGRDYQSVPEAADRLMSDVITRLRQIKPDVMIEFRQGYIGPAMRKYGNIFRVGDEPNNAAGNRIGSMLLRPLTGNTAVHSDMVMWHYEDTVESAAMQLIHAMFTIPQISVRLDEVPTSHVDMIRRYCAFWLEHRDVLINGRIEPHHPQHGYPVVISETEAKVAAAAYADGFIPLPDIGDRTLILANGTLRDHVVIELPEEIGEKRLQIWSCTGNQVLDEEHSFAAGLHKIAIPPAGTAIVMS